MGLLTDLLGNGTSGPAGGVLSGTYPNPAFASDMATQAELDAVAAKFLAFGFPHTASWRMGPGSLAAFQIANMAWAYRSLEGGTISKIGLGVGVQSGNIDVSVYANSGTGRSAVPGARKATSGSVACPAVGYAEVALGSSVEVVAGDWLVFACDNTTATFRNGATSGTTSNLFSGMSMVRSASFPPPATWSAGSPASDRLFVLVGVT